MTCVLKAVYENGIFRPLTPVSDDLADGQQVDLVVDAADQNSENNILRLAANVYAGLSEDDIADIERIALDRSRFFERPSCR